MAKICGKNISIHELVKKGKEIHASALREITFTELSL